MYYLGISGRYDEKKERKKNTGVFMKAQHTFTHEKTEREAIKERTN